MKIYAHRECLLEVAAMAEHWHAVFVAEAKRHHDKGDLDYELSMRSSATTCATLAFELRGRAEKLPPTPSYTCGHPIDEARPCPGCVATAPAIIAARSAGP